MTLPSVISTVSRRILGFPKEGVPDRLRKSPRQDSIGRSHPRGSCAIHLLFQNPVSEEIIPTLALLPINLVSVQGLRSRLGTASGHHSPLKLHHVTPPRHDPFKVLNILIHHYFYSPRLGPSATISLWRKSRAFMRAWSWSRRNASKWMINNTALPWRRTQARGLS